MSVVSTAVHKHKAKGMPLVFSLHDRQVLIHINWEKTTSSQVYLSIEADRDIDILIPNTFGKLKERILDLENRLKMICNE
jgi:hypothetical protein